MNEVAALLASNGVIQCWVGASDQVNDDDIRLLQSGGSVNVNMWIPDDEPDHGNGDCVMLDGGSVGLGMEDCETTHNYLCEFID